MELKNTVINVLGDSITAAAGTSGPEYSYHAVMGRSAGVKTIRNSLLGEVSYFDKLAFSLEARVTENTPPCFMWHTEDDKTVPVENTRCFARAMAAHGVPCEMHLFPHGPHGLGAAEELEDVRKWLPLSGEWIRKQFL